MSEWKHDQSLEPTAEVDKDDVLAALARAERSLRTDVAQNSSLENSASSNNEVILPVSNDTLSDDVSAKRLDHVQQFQMNFSLDDIPDAEGMKEASPTIQPEIVPVSAPAMNPENEIIEKMDTPNNTERRKRRRGIGCLTRFLFIALVLIISCPLAAVISTFLLDMTGSIRSNESCDIRIPEKAHTEMVADILKENGLIGNTYYFRIYSRITGADGKWQPGAFTLQGDMDFSTMIETLQVSQPRESVTVLLREGLTIDEMAVILAENNVCTKREFLNAVLYGEYDYDFLKDIPTESDSEEMMYRVYRLEGYLFPDTYEFYIGSKGETVVNKMLKNFQNKMTDNLLAQIEDKGWTLDEAITFASMIQGEGDTPANMAKVSRVFYNRLDPKSGFKKLELCCTRDYANEMAENDHFSIEKLRPAYNTYEREGLPIGPIGNPGMDAILAVISPSEDAHVSQCYYFATDYKTGTTYFSKTFKEHQAVIKKYGITDLG